MIILFTFFSALVITDNNDGLSVDRNPIEANEDISPQEAQSSTTISTKEGYERIMMIFISNQKK